MVAPRDTKGGGPSLTVDCTREPEPDDGRAAAAAAMDDDDPAAFTFQHDASRSYMVRSLLEPEKLKKMQNDLTNKWGSLSSLSAALQLMESYGVYFTPAEQEELERMDESAQINALVKKMPSQKDEEFQAFIKKLQLLVSTVVGLRKLVEAGQSEELAKALDAAKDSGIMRYVARVGLVHASLHGNACRTKLEDWSQEMDKHLGTLVRGQKDMAMARRRLSAARELVRSQKSTFVNMISGVTSTLSVMGGHALLQYVLLQWRHFHWQESFNTKLEQEFGAREKKGEDQLVEFKARQLATSYPRAVAAALRSDESLVQCVFRAYRSAVADAKLENQLEIAVAAHKESMKTIGKDKVHMTKMLTSYFAEPALKVIGALAFDSWQSVVEEKRSEAAAAAGLTEAATQMKDGMKSKSATVQRVLLSACLEIDAAILSQVMNAWTCESDMARLAREHARKLSEKANVLTSFRLRSKGQGHSILLHSMVRGKLLVLARHLDAWRFCYAAEKSKKDFSAVLDHSRRQLHEVTVIFRSFATKLEQGFAGFEPEPSPQRKISDPKMLSKSRGTVSLPNLKQSQPGGQNHGADSIRSGAGGRRDRSRTPSKTGSRIHSKESFL